MLQAESYAKARALSNPHIYHEEDAARNYGRRIKETEKISREINEEIKYLETKIVR